MIYTKQTKKALKLAYDLHQKQLDKSGLPYIYHPFHIAEQMNDENTTIIALLHDVLEDTKITSEELLKLGFSDIVVENIKILTKPKDKNYFDYIKTIAKYPLAKIVKIADLDHNSDLSRLDIITEKDLKRREKYLQAIEILENESN